MTLSSRTFRIFVSSTFNDFKLERDALQKKVFPRLRDLCNRYGCHFQAIDLRWGISDEASLDQQTVKICIDEISRCQKVSPRPNFIILLGNRYGWRPIPYEIKAEEFEELIKNVSQKDKELLARWYKRDDNSIPAVYCLQVRTGAFIDYQIWADMEADLRSILFDASSKMGVNSNELFKYKASATEQEIVKGALQVADAKEHVFCFIRNISNFQSDMGLGDFIDLDREGNPDNEASSRLGLLKNKLRKSLPDNIFVYDTVWDNGLKPAHIDKLCDDIYRSLSQIIEKEIENLVDIDEITKEVNEHKAFGYGKSKIFLGRIDALNAIDEYIRTTDSRLLVISGLSGTGKTALIAKAADKARKALPMATIIERYIGTTASSLDIRSLISGICGEISRNYQEVELVSDSSNGSKFDHFKDRLQLSSREKPLLIFLDAVDRLSDLDNAREFAWIPDNLPSYVHIIVSATTGASVSSLENKSPKMIRMQNMSLEEGSRLLDLWLEESGRRLQAHQKEEVLRKFSENGLPLYLKLAFEEARRWRSYTPLQYTILNDSVQGIFTDYLNWLSMACNHGNEMVTHSLGYLALSRYGLSEDEVIDLLSSDDKMLMAFKRRSPRSPDVDRLPIFLWSRLFFDLEPYFIVRNIDGSSLLTFENDQLKEIIEKSIPVGLDQDLRLHIARYFNTYDLNDRKMNELPWQLEKAKDLRGLKNCITNLDLFSRMIDRNKEYELRRYWSSIDNEFDIVDEYKLALETFVSTKNPSKSLTRLYNLVGQFMRNYGRLDCAEEIFNRSLEIEENVYGPDSPAAAATLSSLAGILKDKNDISGAEMLYIRSLSIFEKAGMTNEVNFATLLHNIAMVKQGKGELEIAESYFRRALEIYKKASGNHSLNIAFIMSELAELLIMKGINKEASSLIKEALSFVGGIEDPDNPMIASVLINYANIIKKEDVPDAINAYRRAIAILEKAYGPNNREIALCLYQIGILIGEENPDEAERLFLRSLSINESIYGSEHPILAIISRNIGILFLANNKFNDGIMWIEKAVSIAEKCYGPYSIETAQELNNLAKALQLSGDNPGAEKIYQKAVDIFERNIGTDDESAKNTLKSLCLLMLKRRDFDGIEGLLKKSIDLISKALGDDHRFTIDAKCLLAEILFNKGDIKSSEQLYKQILSVMQKMPEHEDESYINVLTNLAILLFIKRDFEESTKILMQSIEITDRSSGPKHFPAIIANYLLAIILERKGDKTAAEPLYDRALNMIDILTDAEQLDIAASLFELAALLHHDIHDYQAAEPLYRRALAIREMKLGPEHSDTASTLANLGNLLRMKSDYLSAELLCRRALDIREKHEGPESYLTALSLNNLANLLRDKGDYDEAEQKYKRSLAIREKILRPEHPDIAISLDNLAMLYGLIGKYESAIELLNRAFAIRVKAFGEDHQDTLAIVDHLNVVQEKKNLKSRYYR